MVRYACGIGLASLVGFTVAPARQGPCGASPTEEQRVRRNAAIAIARQINTAEAQLFPSAQKYMPLPALSDVSVPAGFEVQVSTDGESYTFSVKDTQDECRSAVFSDQKGLIY